MRMQPPLQQQGHQTVEHVGVAHTVDIIEDKHPFAVLREPPGLGPTRVVALAVGEAGQVFRLVEGRFDGPVFEAEVLCQMAFQEQRSKNLR